MLKNILLIAALFSAPLYAADNNRQKAPVPPPPPLPNDGFQEQDSLKADVIIRRGKTRVIEEYRINGQLYMVRVIPKNGKPYYIRYPEGENGRMIRRELDDIQTPYWKLFSW
jgi:hypothetical protein